jgi:hypothetical protein
MSDNNSEPSEKVLDQYEQVQRLGIHNMLDRTGVARYARRQGLNALARAASSSKSYVAVLRYYERHEQSIGNERNR